MQREAIEIFQATVSRNYPDHAVALASSGLKYSTERGKYVEAEQLLTEALQIERNVFGADNQRVARIEEHLAGLYDVKAIMPRAIDAAQAAVKIASKRLGPNHYMTGLLSRRPGDSLFQGQRSGRRRDNAHARHWRYIARSLPAQHLYLASTHQLLGEVLLRRGSLAAAETELREAVDINAALAAPTAGAPRAAPPALAGH